MFPWFIPLPLSFHDHNQVHATVFYITLLTDGYKVNPHDVWKTHAKPKLSRCEIFINVIQFSIELHEKQKIQQSSKMINSAVTHAN